MCRRVACRNWWLGAAVALMLGLACQPGVITDVPADPQDDPLLQCGNDSCESGESCSSCAEDCGACPPVCGNDSCESGETCSSCADDCGACPPVCGNDSCESGETCSTCADDCGTCPTPCGNGTCESGETCSNCASDCGTCPTESWPTDPPAQICGNTALLTGPATAPTGAVTVPAGNNGSFNFSGAGKTFWFAPGVHTGIDGIHPGDNSVFVGGPGAIVDGGHSARNFLTTLWWEGSTVHRAKNVTLRYLTIQNYAPDYQMAAIGQDGGPNLTIEYCTIKDFDRGAAIMMGSNCVVRHNCLTNNGQYAINAFSLDGDPENLVVDHNEISYNDKDDADAATGLGASGGAKFWAVQGARITNNWVHHNKGGAGLWMDTNNNDFLITGNMFSDNEGKGLWYEIGFNATIRYNAFLRNTWKLGPTQSIGGVPEAALYLAHAGGEPRYSTTVTGNAKVEVDHNYFFNNFNGISAYENADLYCGQNDTADCPKYVTASQCVAPGINSEPLHSDCRWQTKNVSVHDNEFHFHKAQVPGCTGSVICGWQAIFSNWGSNPYYGAYKIPDSIVKDQNIVFQNNKYFGDWVFFSYIQSEETVSIIPFSKWQAGGTARANDGHTFTRAPQDVGSTLAP